MEEVIIAQVNLGDTPPLVHRVSQPVLDERGTWIDADVTYEGLMHMTITTKLNLMRLKKQTATTTTSLSSEDNSATSSSVATNNVTTLLTGIASDKSRDAIYDSDAESSGASSTDSDSTLRKNTDNLTE